MFLPEGNAGFIERRHYIHITLVEQCRDHYFTRFRSHLAVSSPFGNRRPLSVLQTTNRCSPWVTSETNMGAG